MQQLFKRYGVSLNVLASRCGLQASGLEKLVFKISQPLSESLGLKLSDLALSLQICDPLLHLSSLLPQKVVLSRYHQAIVNH
jgi:hypothetical protein